MDLNEARYRVAKHLVEQLRDINNDYCFQNVDDAIKRFDLDWSQMVQFQKWAYSESARDPRAAGLTVFFPLYSDIIAQGRRSPTENIHWLNCALEAIQSLHLFENNVYLTSKEPRLSKDAEILASIQALLGRAYQDLANFSEARKHQSQSVSFHRENQSSQRERAMFTGGLATALFHEGKFDKAVQTYQVALGLARRHKERLHEGIILGNFAACFRAMGRHTDAGPMFESALKVAQEIGYRPLECDVLINVAIMYKESQRYEIAEVCFEQSLEIAKALSDQRRIAIIYSNIGWLKHSLNKNEEAIYVLKQAMILSAKLGVLDHKCHILDCAACAYAALGERNRAIRFERTALSIALRAKDTVSEAYCLWNLARFYGFPIDISSFLSLVYFSKARRICKSCGLALKVDEINEQMSLLLREIRRKAVVSCLYLLCIGASIYFNHYITSAIITILFVLTLMPVKLVPRHSRVEESACDAEWACQMSRAK